METDRPQSTTCPDWDDLSAWRDGALDDPAVTAHIERCPLCQEQVRDIELLDAEIEQHLLEAEPDAAAIERMVARTHRQVRGPVRRQLVWLSLKVAACLALVAGIVALWQYRHATPPSLLAGNPRLLAPVDEPRDELSPYEQDLVQRLVIEFGSSTAATRGELSLPSTPAAAEAILKPVAPPMDAPPAAPAGGRSQVTPPGTLNLSTIRMVGFGSPTRGIDYAMPATPPLLPERAQAVADRVRHVWLVDDTTALLRELQVLMPNHKQDFEELITQNQDEYVLQFLLADGDLQGLVNHFAKLNYKLMSPAQPQPDAGNDLRITGKPVRYELDVVRK
jgi:hypothetical protein